MNSIIWVCTEDRGIFPTEEDARENFHIYIRDNDVEYTDEEELFNEWYQPMTFTEYNETFIW